MEDLPKLTPKQAGYVLARLAGKNQADALRQAIPNNRLSPGAFYVEAHKLEHHPKVKAHLDAGWKQLRQDVILTRDKKRQILGSIALDLRAPDTARISAVKEDNAMTGDSKLRFEGEITLGTIFGALVPSGALPTAQAIKTVTEAAADVLPIEDAPLVSAMDRAKEKKTG